MLRPYLRADRLAQRRPGFRPSFITRFSTEADTTAKDKPETASPDEDDSANVHRAPNSFGRWLQEQGRKYQYTTVGPQWLGDTHPFPMNPSFRPPPPMSDAQRADIYRAFQQDPQKFSVRTLAQLHGVSMKRIDAVLRLKGMEDAWRKGRQIETGFRAGMERVLGVKGYSMKTTLQGPSQTPARIHRTLNNINAPPQEPEDDPEFWPSTRKNSDEADLLEELEQRDAARQRYQRMYWESISEDGTDPIVPASLEAARDHHRRQQALQNSNQYIPSIKDTDVYQTPRERVQVVERPGRPTIMFVDVGAKFMDKDDVVRRMTESRRRQKRAKDKSRLSTRQG